MVAITISRYVMGAYINMCVRTIALNASIMIAAKKIQKAILWKRSLFVAFLRNDVNIV